jgi:hypothetical protein
LNLPAIAGVTKAVSATAAMRVLRDFDIFHLTVGLHVPGLDTVVVIDRVDATLGAKLDLVGCT